MARVSVRHALTDREFAFCRIYAAFGEKNAAEAWRRSYCLNVGGAYFEKDDNGVPIGNALDSKAVSKQSALLLKRQHIAEFLAEIRNPTGDHARDALSDQVVFSDDEGQRLKAAQRVLDDEDKLGFRDAAEMHAEILCAIGAEVVVPAPGGGEVAFHAREMFPKYAEALPPRDVIFKTMCSLDQYLYIQNGREAGVERDPADWKMLDGFTEYTRTR